MAQSTEEFRLIDNYFKGLTSQSQVEVGIGDDGAIINTSGSYQTVVATDTLVESVHFPASAQAEQIASRALCVNLSDMAAMGAQPKWFTLALTLPSEKTTDSWLQSFSHGLAKTAKQYNIALIGGDTTAGPLTLSITVLGEIPTGQALVRSGAEVGDIIYVSGTLGDGAAALHSIIQGAQAGPEHNSRLFEHFYSPQPQIELGIGLRDFANACIDISDGLIADLGHICKASGVSAEIDSQQLPIDSELKQQYRGQSFQWATSGGDDYQLCFTIAVAKQREFKEWAVARKLAITKIGNIVAMENNQSSVRLDGQTVPLSSGGYNHFADNA